MLKFRVYDKNNKDVTGEGIWYIDSDGTLCFECDDIDCPVQEAGENYRYEIIVE